MNSSSSKSQNIEFGGKVRIGWAEREVGEYVDRLQAAHPELANRLVGTPFVKFNGLPHETKKTRDSWHVAALFRKRKDFKGSGVSFHVYPDGRVVPLKSDFPTYRVTAATTAEVGQGNEHYINPEYVATWETGKDISVTVDKSDKK